MTMENNTDGKEMAKKLDEFAGMIMTGANSHCSDPSGSGRVATHHAPHMEESPWMALDMKAACEMLDGYDLTEKEKNDLPTLMAGYCRLIDEANLIGYGQTEEEAIASIPQNTN